MSSRTRIKHEISFGQRLANEARSARDVNRLPNLTPHRLPILTPLSGGV